ncbi:MAG: RNA polymerase factor sigma-32 [Deltaproteobacteria bacterium]|nr:RNA polymerase factor sigma-32 [Deltaproteobacteria bacterium]
MSPSKPSKKSSEKKLPAKRNLPVKKVEIVESLEKADSSTKGEALQTYLSNLKKYPLLSPQKEVEVAKKIFDEHDREAQKILILSNLRLVVKIAYEYMRSGFHVLDLIQEGNTGLLQAVKDYDPYRGVKFSSYASYWIKAYIRSFILKNWSLVKIGTTRAQRTLFYKLQKEKNKLEAMGLQPKPKYLAEKLNVKENEVLEMSQRMSGRDLSLNAPLRSDEPEGDSMLHLVKDSEAGADEQLAKQEIAEEFTLRLNSFERTLSGKELIVFRERLRAEEPRTLQEIGDQYHITRERVRQIEARVMEKLKAYIKENAKFSEAIIDLNPPK